MDELDVNAHWDDIVKTERYSDEMQWHEGLGFTRGYKQASEDLETEFKQHKYWDTNHVRR